MSRRAVATGAAVYLGTAASAYYYFKSRRKDGDDLFGAEQKVS